MGAVDKMPDEAAIEAFQRDGATLLKGVFTEWVDTMVTALDEVMANPSARERSYEKTGGSKGFFQDYCTWSNIDGFRAMVMKSPMAEVAARMMRSETARMFHDHILVKEPGASTVTPWHQDQPYYPHDGMQSISFWCPLDPVARERSPEFVAGSHKWSKTYKPLRFDGTDLFPDDDREGLPDINAALGELDVLGWELGPGDAIVFNFRTIHGAPANQSSVRRRAVSFRWVGDDACFAVRPGTTSPDFSHIDYRDGEPFDAPDFPVVYRAH